MARTSSTARGRLIQAALELFTNQGFTATTTRQIADQAQVNEATLFRNFGSKHDLLLAVIEASGMVQEIAELPTGPQSPSLATAIRHYVQARLEHLQPRAELLRALIGEVGQYAPEQRQALGDRLHRMTQDLARYLDARIAPTSTNQGLPPETLASLIHSLLLSYILTHDINPAPRQSSEAFVTSLVTIAVSRTERSQSASSRVAPTHDRPVRDLPAELVRTLLQRAKKQDAQTYALVYLLFGAGLLLEEVVQLERSHHLCSPRQHLVQVSQGAVRQVPVNQWIMGKRYGSYTNNPLSQWLKSRKDDGPRVFVSASGEPWITADVFAQWQQITAGLVTLENTRPALIQARHTWCVEMLIKGMSLEDLSILSGWTVEQLQPYERRAREKAALERAIQLDQRQD
ncbi:MAG: TetR family transcriptional regulator [Cyanobacteria bacterium P01_G01_bin.54]